MVTVEPQRDLDYNQKMPAAFHMDSQVDTHCEDELMSTALLVVYLHFRADMMLNINEIFTENGQHYCVKCFWENERKVNRLA